MIMALPEFKKVFAHEVPVIDLSVLQSGDPAVYRDIAHRIAEASHTMGFFYVVNHGMPASRIDAMFEVARRFFALPLEEKMAIRLALSDKYRGYLPFKMMGADPSLKGNLHEAFQIHAELPPDHPAVLAGKPLHGANQWPASLPGLRTAMLDYFRDMSALSQTFLRMFAAGLDLPPDSFTRYFQNPMMQLRIMHYPPQEPTESGDHLGTRPHTDSGAFTFLAQDEVGGLEILSPAGDWITVPPLRGSFVMNIGEMMKIWTDGMYAATPHRVINRYGLERYSMPFFATPDFDAVITPQLSNPDREKAAEMPRFATSVAGDRPITCGEILTYLYGRIWPSTKVQRVDA
ncbi:MAG: isopenicillin N synthase family oxygenase [Alcaligenaceae bacterium]|nr:isopenicillin N synthase family oxygenase [Alcaligenaceae bacterium SAGV5]MPS50518.1 isopenicillin N synthase family oxygenase [Alcaligenaceae bacterium SAGV3]MPT58347.1 isopenicillin N synthase family oxygenase [Alcaligenaceae bacterium]